MTNVDRIREIAEPRSEEAINRVYCRRFYRQTIREKANRELIEKACEWLKENKDHPFIGCEDPCLSGYLTDEFIEAFKKAMEE